MYPGSLYQQSGYRDFYIIGDFMGRQGNKVVRLGMKNGIIRSRDLQWVHEGRQRGRVRDPGVLPELQIELSAGKI